jgi:hypothetical protein
MAGECASREHDWRSEDRECAQCCPECPEIRRTRPIGPRRPDDREPCRERSGCPAVAPRAANHRQDDQREADRKHERPKALPAASSISARSRTQGLP